jgi:hypothetical protein
MTLEIFAYNSSEKVRPEAAKARFIPRSKKIARTVRSKVKFPLYEVKPYNGEVKVAQIMPLNACRRCLTFHTLLRATHGPIPLCR